MAEYYDSISKGYDELHSKEQKRKLKIITSNLKVTKKDYLLDVGCGTGLSMKPFKCKKMGVDPSVNLLENAEDKVIHAVAESLPFENNTFSIVICVSAIHNFKNPKKAIEEMIRVGKKKFVITLFKKGFNKGKTDRIRKLIEENFTVTKMIEDIHDDIYFCEKTSSMAA